MRKCGKCVRFHFLGLQNKCGRAMISESLIQFFVDGWSCVPSLLFDLRPNYGEGNEENGDLLQNILCTHFCTQCPRPCSRSPLTHVPTGDSWTLTGKHGSVSCGVLVPLSWVVVHTKFDYALQESVSQSCVLVVLCGINDDLLQEGLYHTQVCCAQSPCPWGRSLLTCTSIGDTQTLKGRSGSSLYEPDLPLT